MTISRFKLSIRTRLTLFYGALFLLAGVALILIFVMIFRSNYPTDKTVTRILSNATKLPPDQVRTLREQLDLHRARDLTTMTVQSIIALAAVVAVAVGLGWVIAGRALRPVRRITETARRVADRHLDERIALQGPADELKELADTFDAMLDRLDVAFEAQRQFVANASHELRTPLATNRTLIEVAIAGGRVSAELRELVDTLLETNFRSELIIDGLLTLARSDSQVLRRVPVDLSDAAAAAVERTAHEAATARIEVDATPLPALTLGDPVLLEQVALNLVRNGIRHNYPGGWLQVSTAPGPQPGEAGLTVVNTGPSVPADQVDLLFEPFRRLENSRLSGIQGVGLGLSIVRSVVRSHGGRLVATPRPAGGLHVQVFLPTVHTITSPTRSLPAPGAVANTPLPAGVHVFFTYLSRELRRRMRQAIFIALGLALGIGLVITVNAASNGVRNSQTSVLHALYGVGTDLTLTEAPPAGSDTGIAFSFRQQIKQLRKNQVAAGTKIDLNNLINRQYSALGSSTLATVSKQQDVTSAVGGLTLVDATVTGAVPTISGGGSFRSSFTTNTFTVDGVNLSHTSLGPLSSAKLVSGTGLTAADANSDDALLDSNYATQNKLSTGGTINVGGTTFKIVGIVSAPAGGNPPNAYIPLAKAQSLGKSPSNGSLTNDVNTIYVSAASATDITAVQNEITKAIPAGTVTDQNNLASEVTGSLSSASSLANNLGKWLSVAVLLAAFLLASLLTVAAVTRRVREFGTLKALGWRSTRIIGQVMGESIVIGILGGALGVALGYGGATLIDRLAPKLTATVGASNTASVASSGKGALRSLGNTAHTVSVTLTAPVTINVILLAVVLAVAGGLIAGCFGGWRAARLRPAAALARVE